MKKYQLVQITAMVAVIVLEFGSHWHAAVVVLLGAWFVAHRRAIRFE